MTYKQQLILYLIQKDKIIFEKTQLNYVCEDDLQEIKEDWTERLCYKFLIKLKPRNDANSCPWCICKREYYINYLEKCDNCGYAKRNGKCNKDSSTYSKIIKVLHRKEDIFEIARLKSVRDLITKTKLKFNIKRFFDFIAFRIPKKER